MATTNNTQGIPPSYSTTTTGGNTNQFMRETGDYMDTSSANDSMNDSNPSANPGGISQAAQEIAKPHATSVPGNFNHPANQDFNVHRANLNDGSNNMTDPAHDTAQPHDLAQNSGMQPKSVKVAPRFENFALTNPDSGNMSSAPNSDSVARSSEQFGSGNEDTNQPSTGFDNQRHATHPHAHPVPEFKPSDNRNATPGQTGFNDERYPVHVSEPSNASNNHHNQQASTGYANQHMVPNQDPSHFSSKPSSNAEQMGSMNRTMQQVNPDFGHQQDRSEFRAQPTDLNKHTGTNEPPLPPRPDEQNLGSTGGRDATGQYARPPQHPDVSNAAHRPDVAHGHQDDNLNTAGKRDPNVDAFANKAPDTRGQQSTSAGGFATRGPDPSVNQAGSGQRLVGKVEAAVGSALRSSALKEKGLQKQREADMSDKLRAEQADPYSIHLRPERTKLD